MISFMIDDDLRAGLELVKDRDGMFTSEQLRRAVREWLERRGVQVGTTRTRRSVARKKR
jgi:hypothetical protein